MADKHKLDNNFSLPDNKNMNLIGRPRDKSTQNLICPRCQNKDMRKSGFRYLYNRNFTRKKQAYVCKICHFQTIKPLIDDDATN